MGTDGRNLAKYFAVAPDLVMTIIHAALNSSEALTAEYARASIVPICGASLDRMTSLPEFNIAM
eukprot:CAMPEP_0197532488 /NCGR_PEP_ID=MMETSP1318-20131121/39908_1 /TAXON_ID=552666 /ORGANISM="Partenskyella glossopodia, Strain RCC365" /LENGTH=63 /DNA_ID=CAMNT_0043089059 /DNA_START=213 /DNA_END=404 /DNA_ORIENTATION=+